VPVVKKKVTASFNRAAIGKSFRSQAALVLAGVCVDLGSELCVGWGGGLEGEGWGRGGRGGRGGLGGWGINGSGWGNVNNVF